MTTWDAVVLGAAIVERDDAVATPWRDARLDKLASPAARMLVEAVVRALGAPGADTDRVGVYIASGETGLDVTAFLDAAHVAWDEHPDDPDYRFMGGRALRAIDPYYSLRSLANGPASLLATHLGATGPSVNFAHQPEGVAWALAAALDDVSAGRCDVAVVGACDLPAIPTRQAVARLAGSEALGDEAGVLVVGRSSRRAGAPVRIGVRWDQAATFAPDALERGVVAPLKSIVLAGTTQAWTSACAASIDTPTGRVTIDVQPVRC